MSTDDTHSGIPTRAIHEAYLDMQRSLKAYREAKDQQDQYAIQTAHGEFQSHVLTLYELMRPHLRNQQAVRDYYDGKLPSYNLDATPPDPDDGKGILQVQENRDTITLNGQVDDPNSLENFKEWHNALEMNGNIRITDINGLGDEVFVTMHYYQRGLRHMDDWETKYNRRVTEKDGFMNTTRETQVQRQRIPIDRLKRAGRELADAADELDFLSPTGTPTNEDTQPI